MSGCAITLGVGALAVLTGGLVACGARVTVDRADATGGGGGASAVNAANATNTTAATTTAASTGTGPATPCESACAALAPCGASSTCVADCSASAATCPELFDPFLQCIAASLSGAACGMPVDCLSSLYAWLPCAGWCNTLSGACSGLDGSCDCSTDTCAPEGKYLASCVASADGTYDCGCYHDERLVGQCVGDMPSSCFNVYASCCSALFFVQGA